MEKCGQSIPPNIPVLDYKPTVKHLCCRQKYMPPEGCVQISEESKIPLLLGLRKRTTIERSNLLWAETDICVGFYITRR
jgi:hypothetical protein